ncbi:MAG TPA: AAA family ATPase [Miltoncostaeales bacterium]|nr:AAA family ATPase [Miltoncostaeales bacterium]
MVVTRMRRGIIIGAVAALCVCAAPAVAQTAAPTAKSTGTTASKTTTASKATKATKATPPTKTVTAPEAINALRSGTIRRGEIVRDGSSVMLRLLDRKGSIIQAPITTDQVMSLTLQAAVDRNVPLKEVTKPAPAQPATSPSVAETPFSIGDWLQEWGGMILMALLVLLVGMTMLMMRGNRFSKKVKPVDSTTKFADVAGIDEIRDEVIEIADYLRDPSYYEKMGAKLPKGIVLYGPPGTGKTLLAKAVAGEAGVPFFSASGSEFVEVYVGVGARRIRDLFQAARKAAPALLYIDEIDAIGERRSGGGGGGGEREHTATLDQLLSEMDGFDLDPTRPVVVLASTNRLEHLDPALVRSGRFDRKIAVGLPDREARTRILAVHMRTRPLAPEVELAQVAAFTAGMAGADLAALCNEAAFEATRAKRSQIALEDFRKALLRLAAGPEKRTQVISEPERRLVAYHEMGHAIVGHMLPSCEPVERVTVIPQGQALGVTVSIPEEDYFLATRQEYLDRLARIMGGRAAEELIFGEMTSGAADDLRKATELARTMVEQLGMARSTTEESLAVGLAGGSRGPEGEGRVENEIQEILASAYRAAYEVLADNEALLHRSAKALLEAEALDREEIEMLLGPRPVAQRLVPRARTNPFPRFSAKRNQFAREFGEGVPEVRAITDVEHS